MAGHWGDTVSEKTAAFGALVLGVDPDPADIPLVFRTASGTDGLRRYVEFLISAAAGRVGFIKFQSAYFEAYGSDGPSVLAGAMVLARKAGMSVILDAKRGDIGSTAAAYARAYLMPGGSDLEADCLTVNPFMGRDTLEPFVDCARTHGKGVFVLTRTSNPGAAWLQDGDAARKIAAEVGRLAGETTGASGLGCVGAVIGATAADDGGRLRHLMPCAVILTPGVGAQGGDPGSLTAMRNTGGGGILVPVSRAVTRVPDIRIGDDVYGEIIESRIAALKASLRGENRP